MTHLQWINLAETAGLPPVVPVGEVPAELNGPVARVNHQRHPLRAAAAACRLSPWKVNILSFNLILVH